MNSMLWTLDSRYWIPDLVEFGFWIPTVSGIPDSLSRFPDFKAQGSRFLKKNFSRLRNPDLLTLGDMWISGINPTSSTISSAYYNNIVTILKYRRAS